MSTQSDLIIEEWNKEYRTFSEQYIKSHQESILNNCLFPSEELANGHLHALHDIEKNKGNICQFVTKYTPTKHLNTLPNKLLSDTYSFHKSKHNYKMVYQNVLSDFISWKPGTTNALSKELLNVSYGNEHFQCKFRKYQLESMKKFIQATPGTKEIRGQWAANLANDSLMVSFNAGNIILVIQIGCFMDKLHIMYEENSLLRKNSKIRKQTLLTHCWGLEKTKLSNKFNNSIIIQEHYGIELYAHEILTYSPIRIYMKNGMNNLQSLRINNLMVNLNNKPYYIGNITMPVLDYESKQELRSKYRNILAKGNKLKKGTSKPKPKPKGPKVVKKSVIMKEENTSESDDSDFYPIKPSRNSNNNDNDDEKWYSNKSKKKNKKDLDMYYTNDSTSCVSVPDINGKEAAAVSFIGFTTPQQPTYDINNFNDTPMGNTMGNTPMDYSTNGMDTPMDTSLLNIPPNVTNNTFDSVSIPNGLNSTMNDTYLDDWTSFDTPNTNPIPMNRYSSIDSLNNNQFNNFDTNIPFNNNYIPNDIDLDLPLNNNINNTYPLFMDYNNNINNINTNNNTEVNQLRQQNELLLRRVEQQQRQIDFLASQIGAIHSNNHSNDTYVSQPHNPLKRRRITPEALLPPAA